MFTFECKIKSKEAIPFLEEMNSLYGHLERKLHQVLYIKKPSDKNKLKRDFCKSEGISSTHYNSLKTSLSAKIDSKLELAKVNVKEDEERVSKTTKTITKKEKRIGKLKEVIKNIRIYEERLRRYNRSVFKSLLKKPKKSSTVDSCRPLHELRAELKQLKHEVHQKKRRLGSLRSRLEKNKKMLTSESVSICFGSKKLLNKQHHLKENGYSSHEEWKKEWEFSRSNQSFWLGDSTEKERNRNARLNLDEGTIRFTVPERLRDKFGPTVTVKGLSFDQRSEESIRKSQEYEEQYFHVKSGKFRKRRYPVSCRILERMKKKDSCFYLQVCIEVPPNKIVTNKDNGAIGVDLNIDHFAVGEIDRFGNPVNSFSIPFTMEEKSSEQIKASFGEAIRDIVLHAKSLSRPIVMERLDFTTKRASLRETCGAKLSKKLSLFSYSKMHQMMKSRCQREGVELIDVNPAFSSLLGSYLYYGMKHLYTPHEMAAFVLARRGVGFQDMYKPVCNDRDHKALFGTVGIQPEKAPPSFGSFRREFGPRHLWSYLRRYWKAFSMIMQSLKRESSSVYSRSLEKWRSNVEGLHRSLDDFELSLGLEDVASQPIG